MSILSPELNVCHLSNTEMVHPVIGVKQVSFHEDVINPGSSNLVQVQIGHYEERGVPEGQEDPVPTETSKRSLSKTLKPKFRSLYLDGLNVDYKSQKIILNKIQLETEKKEWNSGWNKHLDVKSNQLINIIKRDLSLQNNESIYKVSINKIFMFVSFDIYYIFYFIFRFIEC